MDTALFETTGSLTGKIFRKITDISPYDWLSVLPDVLENYYFFKTLNDVHFPQFKFYYLMVYEKETPVGAAPCFFMDYPLDTTVVGPMKYVLKAVRKVLPGIMSLKAVICGIPMGPGRIGVKKEASRPVVREIVRCMEWIASEEKASVLAFKDFEPLQTVHLDFLRSEGFLKVQDIPNTEMAVTFENFEQYLKTLSRVSREGLKRKFKKIDGHVNIELEIADCLGDSLDDVYDLYLQTVRRAEFQFEVVPKEFFTVVPENVPEAKFFIWRIDQRPVAFAFCLVSKERLIDYYLGFDYSIAYQYHLYFVRFRDLLKWCIINKIERYEMGVTNYEPKRRLGFDFVPLYIYAKHRKPWFNLFFKMLGCLLKPENFETVFEDMKRDPPRM